MPKVNNNSILPKCKCKTHGRVDIEVLEIMPVLIPDKTRRSFRIIGRLSLRLVRRGY